ncbi:MOSC domain-containing protein [Terriglobus saanensis]|uniref:MOSC domain containing protein n=1 Tax=Terriglobus saanensis (strain ATCC BAA-1853 / DSM 23119 / SP1PR4) TaxID=401053 RepID=E8V5E4_TERSS|nr:MOSC domain-containing protein [Terriglobus saanensis]ADV84903.1 MOSC domain containing protein [Terriglobus saanensis SP1PR4]
MLVEAVSLSARHGFCKEPQIFVRLLAGVGVEGDAHAGKTVQHLHDKRKDPTQLNRKQVHLLEAEFLEELAAKGFRLRPGEFGENILTRGLALAELPEGTELCLGEQAVVQLTGLRNPCVQIDRFQSGLLAETIEQLNSGERRFKAGVMGVVLLGGDVASGDAIRVKLPLTPKAMVRI